MSGASYSPWDSAEFLTDDETIIEYLKAALEESDPLIFLKAARNVARARGISSDELPDRVPALSPALEEEIRSTLGPEVSEDFSGWRVLEDIEAGAGPETECERCGKSGTPGSNSSTWVSRYALSARMSASRSWGGRDVGITTITKSNYRWASAPPIN